ncbi:hypothetical protein VPNG_06727 [Cytospora leucostoma]|uniref:J domain-containing protein n=1 Tax=Cytospora leucostoma TaxID=1230097 RepID=A0A423WSZ2_9PEZI|nr:hypothetical protein VPNG_06727 [Cytospora leucostoma]
MSDTEDNLNVELPVIDPYEVLGLERTATADQVKLAYRKAALKNHPGIPTLELTSGRHPPPNQTDKVPEAQKATAHTTFQGIALAYAVLSSPSRRARYDATGSTSESVVDAEGFDWSDFYREQFADAVSGGAIARFAAAYKGSDEERDDVLAAYEAHGGDMDGVYESVMLSSVLEDDERFRGVIEEAIAAGDVEAYGAYTREGKRKREGRAAAARREAGEAEEYAKELGVHDKLFGDDGKGKGKGKGKESNGEDALAALIRGRQKERSEDFLANLAEKYAGGPKKTKTKRKAEEEPDEEAFQAAAARLTKKKAAHDSAPKATKKSRR